MLSRCRNSSILPGAASLFYACLLLLVSPFALADGDKTWRGPGPTGWSGDLAPIGPGDWSTDRAAHLLERAGFGGTPEEIAELAALSPEAAVGRLIDVSAIDNSHVPPFDESGIFDETIEPFPPSRAQAVAWARRDGEAMGVKVKPSGDRPFQPIVNRYFYYLRSDRLEAHRLGQYWAQRMLITHRPLEEKMALFWHDHFATTNDKVRDYRKIRDQIDLFRAQGLGNFRDLMVSVAQGPAMLVFLDAKENVKDHPNENFGREVLELFTLGIGNYTETDIREAARAFTGWRSDGLRFVVDADQHDNGEKTFLGQTGNLDGIDVIDIALEHEATARFIAGKIYRYFVNDTPSPEVIDSLASAFRESGYEIKPLMRRIFLSRDFYGPTSYATLIKSPVQLVASTYRKLGVRTLPGIPDFHETTETLGQKLLYPPNVAGWEGGRSWITPATLVERGNFVRDMLFPQVGDYSGPDRQLPGIYREVGRKLNRGFDITSATIEGHGDGGMMSMANMMVASADEEYNTRYGAYHGTIEAMRRVKPIPRIPAVIDITAMVRDNRLVSTIEVVDYLERRLLRARLAPAQRSALADFLENELGTADVSSALSYAEEPLRLLIHLIMSTPEYQLS